LAESQGDPVASAIERAKEGAAAAAAGDAISEKRYADALAALADYQDPRVADVAVSAMQSPSYAARASLLRVMRYNPEASADPDSLADLRGLVTNDPNPQVRREALEVLVRYGDSAEVLSLVQGLGRREGPVRDIAVREWVRIETEMAAAAEAATEDAERHYGISTYGEQ